jgi:hypothetical protein
MDTTPAQGSQASPGSASDAAGGAPAALADARVESGAAPGAGGGADAVRATDSLAAPAGTVDAAGGAADLAGTSPGDGSADAAGNQPSGAGRWESLPSLLRARGEAGVAAIGARLYVVGGYSNVLEVFDTMTGKWEALPSLPATVDHPNVAAVGDKLYVVGAFQAGAFFVYAPDTRAWSRIAPMPAGTDRGGSGVGVIGTRIYVGGGQRGGRSVADASAYDTATDRWEGLPPLPTPRDHLVGAGVGGIFYVLGGRTNGRQNVIARVDAFDPGAAAWTARAPMPTARGGCAAAVLGGRVYVFGGEGNPAAPTGAFPQTEMYDPAADRWTSLAPMKTPRHGLGAAAIGDRIYLPAGSVREGGGSSVPLFEAFQP